MVQAHVCIINNFEIRIFFHTYHPGTQFSCWPNGAWSFYFKSNTLSNQIKKNGVRSKPSILMKHFCQADVAVTLNVFSTGARFESQPTTLVILYQYGGRRVSSPRRLQLTSRTVPRLRDGRLLQATLQLTILQQRITRRYYSLRYRVRKQTPTKETVWWHETASKKEITCSGPITILTFRNRASYT